MDIGQEKILEIRNYIQENRDFFQNPDDFLIPLLHRIQNCFTFIPEPLVHLINRELSVPICRIYGIITFYHFFSLKPDAKYKISICNGTACYVAGSTEIIKQTQEHLQVGEGETTADGLFSYRIARCLGCCGQAPVIQVNQDFFVKVKPWEIPKIIKKFIPQKTEQ